MNIWKWIFSVIAAIAIIVSVALALGLTKKDQIGTIVETFSGPMPPTAVNIGSPSEATWEVSIPAVGTVTSVEGITVSPETPGIIEKILFKAGSTVEAGDILIELNKEIEKANLAQAEASLDLAKKTLRRSEDLFKTRSIAQAELDSARSQASAAEAAVLSVQSILAQKTIKAPFAGRLGVRQISVGQYLDPGESVVVLQSVDPVFIEFSLPQRNLGRIAEGYSVRAKIDAFPDNEFTGELSAISPQVDRATRNVLIQATFENPEQLLRPGMFTRVEVIMPVKRDVVVVPIMAVHYSPTGNRIYVAEENENGQFVSQQTIVRLGETRGDFVEIIDGLEGDERIVVDGAFKLLDGSPIFQSERGTVEPQLEPTPENN
jgi:membrane fusion protein (multidrug efflux system)|tara:strand:- start:4792 stop:5919 length:1128 start_codon:yes stop_codon:yes gene_type:complete